MLFNFAQLLAYTLMQAFGISIFTLSLQRLGKISSVYRVRAFIYLLMVNVAGALTFGIASWLSTSRPVAAGLFLLGIPFGLATHLYLAYRQIKRQ